MHCLFHDHFTATLDDVLVSSSCDISTSICVLECQVAYTSIPPNVTWHAPPSLPQISSGDVIGRMSVTEAPLVGLITSSLMITDADPGQDNMNYTCQANLFSVTSLQNTTYLEIPIGKNLSIVCICVVVGRCQISVGGVGWCWSLHPPSETLN